MKKTIAFIAILLALMVLTILGKVFKFLAASTFKVLMIILVVVLIVYLLAKVILSRKE